MHWTALVRRGLAIGLPAAVVLLLASALILWRSERSAARPAYAGASELAGALGVNLEAGELADEALPGRLAALAAGGVRWVRFVIPWDQVEPAPGRFDWALPDRLFALLSAYPDLKPLVVLNGSPAWARRAGDADNPLAPPQERRDFGAFAAAVARRYGLLVDAYQIWHEPNIAPHWGRRPVAPEDYLGLLREAALQIRSADPDAQIVLAALAPNTEPGGANMSDVAFLDALYRAGGRPWFDAAAAQPYGFSAPATAPADPAAFNFARAQLLREVMVRHGDGRKRLWATAFGWNALPESWTGRASPWGQVTIAQQADYARQAVELAATRWPWLGPLFWAATCPARPADDPWVGFALCAADGSWRPAWSALAEAAHAPPVLPPGDHAVSHAAVRYSAGWRVVPAAADPGADGDVLAYEFLGTETALRVQGGPFWAFLRVWIDGRPANALPTDETGAAYLVLYDPLAEERTVTLAAGLSPGRHRAIVEAHGGWGQWPLRGIQVCDGAAPGPLARLDPRALAWAAVGLAAIWLIMTGRPWKGAVVPAAFAFPAGLSSLWKRTRGGKPAAFPWAAWPDAAWYAVGAALFLACLLSRWLLLDLVALGGLGLLFLARPDVALPLIAAAIPLWPRPKALAGLEFSLYELLIWVAAAAALVRALGTGSWQRASDRSLSAPDAASPAGLDRPVLALLLVGLAAALAAERTDVALREFRTVFLLAGLFYGLIVHTPWPAGRRFSPRPLLIGLLVGMVFVSLVALVQFVTGQGRIDVEGVGRVRAFYGSPNNLALVLDRAVPLSLALAAFGARHRRGGATAARWPARLDRERLFYGVAFVVTFLACIVTYSKGALLLGLPAGVATVLIGGAWRSGRRWPLWALAGLAVVGAAGLFWLMRTPRFAHLTDLDAGTGFFRLKLWQSAWRMWLDHPWLGVGPDNFLYAYRTRYVLPTAWQELNLSHPHNIVLDFATRLGAVGMAVGAWLFTAAFRRGRQAIGAAAGRAWPMALGLVAGLVATVAHGLIDNSVFLMDLMALFMLTLALLERSDEVS